MAVKYAAKIVEEIKKKGHITVSEDYVTGEAFEKWLYKDNNIDKQHDKER